MPPVTNKMCPIFTRFTIAAVSFMAVSVHADQRSGNAPLPENEPGFFQRASNDVGGFFRKLFKSDEEQQPPPTAPSRYRSRSRSGPRYNLDQAPAELLETPISSSRPNSPPATVTTSKSASNTKVKPPAITSSSEIPHIQEPTKSKTRKVATADSSQKNIPTDTAPPPKTKTTKQPETTPASADKGGVLYSNAGDTHTKQPEPPANADTGVIPTPPKAPAESSSVLMGSKTGKTGRVRSPYAPYSELDVTGLPSGSLALDPTTQKVFRIP